MIYQPKGSMCIACVHATRDCSGLDFSKMPIIGLYRKIAHVVACTEYKKKEQT